MSPQLSFDIQVEIIKRLPVKSLIQFRSVCKAWKSLIDSPRFITGYNNNDQPHHHLMITSRSGLENEHKHVCFLDDDTFPEQKSFHTIIPHLARTTTVIGSSHGLLCVNGYLSSLKKLAVLWNPAIRKSIAIVVPDEVHGPPSPFYSYVVGFGVCPATKDPKLVRIRYIDDQTKINSISRIPCQVMVFTLSSGEWRCLCSNQLLPRKSIQFTNSRTVIGRFIYWFGNDWIDGHVNGESCNVIMSFDLSTDVFKEVNLPDSLRRAVLSVSRVRESLVLLEDDINFTTRKQVCNVWMMIMEDGYFTKVYSIKAPTPNGSFFWTIAFRNNGEAIIAVNDDDEEKDEHVFSQSALVYDPCLENVKDLGIRGNRGSLNVNSYTESLLLLDHDAGHIVNCTWSCEET